MMKSYLCTDKGSLCNVAHINLSVVCDMHVDRKTF